MTLILHLIDVNLNEAGRSQARNAGSKIRASKEAIELAKTSSLRRTTETCLLALGNHASRINFIAIEGCRERTGKHFSDQRTDVRETAKLFPGVDFSRIHIGVDIRHHPTEEEEYEAAVQRSRGFFWNLQHHPQKLSPYSPMAHSFMFVLLGA